MAENTGISWTDSTANLWIGCTKVSPACDHCYAERDWGQGGMRARVEWGPNGDRSRTKSGWEDLPRWNKLPYVECLSCGKRCEERKCETVQNPAGYHPPVASALACPKCNSPSMKQVIRRVFINSLSDIGDNHPSITWHGEAFALLEKCNLLTIQLVTKRPKMLRKLVERHVPHWLEPGGWPANIWVLVTVEDQERADERREALRAIPAPIRGVSYEPALGPVDWTQWDFINWLISGGESGPKARPSHPDWFRAARDWCAGSGVAYLHKQNGEWAESVSGARCVALDGRNMPNLEPTGSNGDDTVRIARLGTKRSGHLLDGKEHKGFPHDG